MSQEIQEIVGKLVDNVVNPIIAALFAVGLLVFAYGVVEFMWGLSQETDKRETGKKHMLYGIIGMFVMVAGYALLTLIKNSICSLAGGMGGPACQ